MEFVADAKDLRDAVRLVKPAIDTRRFAGIHLATGHNQVTLTAASSDVTIRTTVFAGISEAGAVLLHSRLLGDAIKGDSDDILFQATGDEDVTVINETTETLRAMTLEDWPAPTTVTGPRLSVPAAALAAVAPAVATGSDRPTITGVLFTGDTLVATDGFRLHLEPVGAERLAKPVIIAAAAVAAAAKATKGDGRVTVTVGDDEARIDTGAAAYTARLIPGDYPPFASLVPADPPHRCRVARAELIAAAETWVKVASRTSPLRIRFGDDAVTVTMTVPDQGDVTAHTLRCAWTAGPPAGETLWEHELGLNPRFLIECLATLTSEQVTIGFSDFAHPVLYIDQPGQTRLQMPIRLT